MSQEGSAGVHIKVNGQETLFAGQTLAELIAQRQPKMPFAIAVNTVFVPKQQYGAYQLNADDQVDIVNPVVGG